MRYLMSMLLLLMIGTSVQGASPDFLREVAPILVQRCLACHGEQKARGDYRIVSFDQLLQPGKSGETPIIASKIDDSQLFQRLIEENPQRRMPPDDEPLSTAEIALIKQWIVDGAKFDGDHKSPLKSIIPPRTHPASPLKYPSPIPVMSLAFHPDGKEIAVGGLNEVTIWDADSGKLVRRIPHLPQRIQSLTFDRRGEQLLVGGGTPGEYGEALIVDAKTGQKVRVLGTFDDIVMSVTFSLDETLIAAGAADRSVRVWNRVDGKEQWRAQLHSDWVTGVSFSPDGRFLISASRDKTLKVLEVANGRLFTTYNGHRMQYGPQRGMFEVYAVSFGTEGVTAYSAGEGKSIRAWNPVQAQEENGNAADMEERFLKVGHTKYFEHPATKPLFTIRVRGTSLFTGSGDGVVRQHDIASGKVVRDFEGLKDWVYVVDANVATKRVAGGGFSGDVCVWDVATGQVVRRFRASP